MNISYEMIGIIATFIVLGSILAVTGANTLDFDLGTGELGLPQINAGTNNVSDGFYEYCYRMGLDC